MVDADFPDELGNIPYSKIIGGPLNAAVEANAEASQTAADFIQDVGFTDGDGTGPFDDEREPVYVTFHYTKETRADEGGFSEEKFEMKVPLLLLLHIPYFEVETVTVDFNVKLNSVEKKSTEQDIGVGGGFAGGGFFVRGSYQRTDKHDQKVQRSYDQSVHVEAGSIEPPAGVTRVFDVLEQTITEEQGEEDEEEGEEDGED